MLLNQEFAQQHHQYDGESRVKSIKRELAARSQHAGCYIFISYYASVHHEHTRTA